MLNDSKSASKGCVEWGGPKSEAFLSVFGKKNAAASPGYGYGSKLTQELDSRF